MLSQLLGTHKEPVNVYKRQKIDGNKKTCTESHELQILSSYF